MLSPNEIKKIELESPQEESTEETDKRALSGKADEDVDFTMGKIAELLGESSADKNKFDMELRALHEYAKDKGAGSLEDILWEIRYLANSLGTPGYGENRIKFMYHYVYLVNEDKHIQNELKKMEAFNAK